MIAVPVDPQSLVRRAVTSRPSATDSASLLDRLSDSAATLDARFQSERDALNREARSLAGIDRRAGEYHAQYDAFRKREIAAESLRQARDRLRARVTPLATRFAAAANAGGVVQTSRRLDVEAATNGVRHTVVTAAQHDTISLRLPDGTWWLGVASRGLVPLVWTKVEVPSAKSVILDR